MSTWMLIDGNSLTFRAFFALPTDMTTSSGQATNAVYGFASMLVNLFRDHAPDHLVVTFDHPDPTFRHELVAGYKANRDETPELLVGQFPLVRQLVASLGIPVVEVAGVEADDVLATLAKRAATSGEDAVVVTGDRDSFQLVSDPHVTVLYNRRGVSDYVIYDEAGIEERTGVPPSMYVEYAALRGDPSDNLPGVPGVGEKTAAKLIMKYGGIDGIYEHLDEASPKLRENLAVNEELVRMNTRVMAAVEDVPVVPDLADLEMHPPNAEAFAEVADLLELGSMRERLTAAFAIPRRPDDGGLATKAMAGIGDRTADDVDASSDEPTVICLEGSESAVAWIAALVDAGHPVGLAGVISGSTGRPRVDLLAVADGLGAEVGVLCDEIVSDEGVVDALRTLVSTSGPGVRGHGLKPLVRGLLDLGVDPRRLVMDTRIAAYLLDPSGTSYELSDLLSSFGGARWSDVTGHGQGVLDLDGGGTDSRVVEAAAAASSAASLSVRLEERIESQGLSKLLHEVEIPLIRVLAKMELVGVAVDRDRLQQLSDELAAEADLRRRQVWLHAGEEFNLNSTRQLAEVLYDRLGLPALKKTKTGRSTDAATLERLADQHPIIEELLRYREVEKLRSTFANGLLAEIEVDGRVHATFHQTVARTGRLSSDAPNLHNIPVRSDLGRRFREVFVAEGGFELLTADYDQIELRCIAHLSGDEGLIDAFSRGEDIHAETAARLFGVEPGAVTTDQRSKAKMVSYGLAYGMEAYGLAQRLGVATAEAAEILDAYFEAFPGVRTLMDESVREARSRGYTLTEFGRRRPIPELHSPNHRIRLAAERQAMNAAIQGLAADMFKVALVALDDGLEEMAAASRIVLQVHDEVIVETAVSEMSVVRDLVVASMKDAFELRVPLAVHVSTGRTWADAKS